MPKHSRTYELPSTPSDTLAIARRLVVERGWAVKSLEDGRLVARRGWTATGWPITVELLISAAGPPTEVTVNGKIGGIGPIQRHHLVRALDELQSAMEFEAARGPEAVRPGERTS